MNFFNQANVFRFFLSCTAGSALAHGEMVTLTVCVLCWAASFYVSFKENK